MHIKSVTAAFACALGLSTMLVLAAENTQPDRAWRTAHEHGVARLMLATGGDGLEVMLETPAVNVFGFENLPATDAERKQVQLVRRKLEMGDKLFELNPEAGCSLLDTEVASSLLADVHAGQDGFEHRDVDVSWSFSCAKPDALKTVTIHLFEVFPGFKQINAEWATESGESSIVLAADGVIIL